MTKKTKKRFKDDRLNRKRTFLQEFSVIFLIVYISSVGFTLMYNYLLNNSTQIISISLGILSYLLFICLVASSAISFLQSRFFTRRLQDICTAAKKVAGGDFSVRIEQWQQDGRKNEIGIMVDDFNTMVTELSSIESLKDGFISDVSHEIKTPLSVIKGYTDLLRNPAIPENTKSEYINEISNATDKLTTLVTNILKLNKIESQEIVQKESFSLDEQLRSCVLDIEESFEKKGIAYEAELDEVNIVSDKSLLEIVWSNLLRNALKYTENGGTVKVSLKLSGEKALVTVSDTGCGMALSTQQHIFDKFYQGDTSHSAEGNGLGLSIVCRVLILLHGEITVHSNLGVGSEFTVMLPLTLF